MWHRIKEWWQAEGDLAQLQGVSDRMLQDMGLDREELRGMVHGRVVPQQDRHDGHRHPLGPVPVRRGTACAHGG